MNLTRAGTSFLILATLCLLSQGCASRDCQACNASSDMIIQQESPRVPNIQLIWDDMYESRMSVLNKYSDNMRSYVNTLELSEIEKNHIIIYIEQVDNSTNAMYRIYAKLSGFEIESQQNCAE